MGCIVLACVKVNWCWCSIQWGVLSCGRILEQVYNIVSQQYAISTWLVLIIFGSLFIQGIWGWKLNSCKFYYNYPIRNLSKGQRCGLLELIGCPTITIEGHPRLSNYFEWFLIQEVPLSRYWPSVGYANDFRHWITLISSPNHWFPAVLIYILSRHWPLVGRCRHNICHFWKKINDKARSNPGLHLYF